MTDLTKEQVIGLLAMHDYKVPEPDLTEVVNRINALMDTLKSLDALDLYHVEPWPVQPLRSPDHG